MKDIDQKDTPDVSGGYVSPSTDGGCFPWPEDPTEPKYPPQDPIVPTDPYENR